MYMLVFGLAALWNSKHATICYGFETIFCVHGYLCRARSWCMVTRSARCLRIWAIASTSILALSPVAG